jgi:hypothetical protein
VTVKSTGTKINANTITNEVGTAADCAFLSKASAKVIKLTPAPKAELELAA